MFSGGFCFLFFGGFVLFFGFLFVCWAFLRYILAFFFFLNENFCLPSWQSLLNEPTASLFGMRV